MTPELAGAVADLYAVFAALPRTPLVGCPCCVDPDDSALLARGPRSGLPAALLGRYAGKAMTTWGEAEHARWFLPRIAELVALERGLDVDIGRLARLCVTAGWADWTPRERAAVTAYLDALWGAAVVEAWAGLELVEASLGLGGDVAPWIDVVVTDGDVAVLAELVAEVMVSDAPEALHVRPLLARAAVHDRLVAAYVAAPDDNLAYACDLLASLGVPGVSHGSSSP